MSNISVEFVIQKLKEYNQKIQSYQSINQDFWNLIGIDLFDFIQGEPTLKTEFFSRAEYFEQLAQDKDFIIVQKRLFEKIVKILALVSIEKIKSIQELYNADNPINTFEFPCKGYLTMVEFYQVAQREENYYTLKAEELDYRKSQRLTFTIEDRNRIIAQYKATEFMVEDTFTWLARQEPLPANYQKLRNEYSELYDKLERKIYRQPTKLHANEFNRLLFIFTGYNRVEGYEIFKGFFGENSFEQIKHVCLVVISDLIEHVEQLERQKSAAQQGMDNKTLKTSLIKGDIRLDKYIGFSEKNKALYFAPDEAGNFEESEHIEPQLVHLIGYLVNMVHTDNPAKSLQQLADNLASTKGSISNKIRDLTKISNSRGVKHILIKNENDGWKVNPSLDFYPNFTPHRTIHHGVGEFGE